MVLERNCVIAFIQLYLKMKSLAIAFKSVSREEEICVLIFILMLLKSCISIMMVSQMTVC